MKLLRALVASPLLISIAALVSCSFDPTPPPPEEIKLKGAEVYLSRGGLGRTDYEQYKLSAQTVVLECGQIINGRHTVAEQNFLKPTPEFVNEVKDAAWDIRRLVVEKNAQYKAPGDNIGLLDPGIASISLDFPKEPIRVKTDFDSIATPGASREYAAQRLVIAFRKLAGNAPCGRQDFYGMPNR